MKNNYTDLQAFGLKMTKKMLFIVTLVLILVMFLNYLKNLTVKNF